MDLKSRLLAELKHEVSLSEKMLARVPADKMDWQPHEKSMTVKRLMNHLAEIPGWVTGTLDVDELDISKYDRKDADTPEAAIAHLHEMAADAYKSIENADDAEYEKNWRMVDGEQVLMEMEKYDCLRKMVMPQMPHHRAQLGVYLRLLEESVPATYGPSADEHS